ncbi:Ig domain-containing protein [Ideonella sp.]|uniref:Ig domain-containing protein n=1 Tax=Ideonella sp. TaxID=1929293 RepID=UPI0035B1669C
MGTGGRTWGLNPAWVLLRAVVMGALAVAMTACGGGGGGGAQENLVLTYDYGDANMTELLVLREQTLPAPRTDGLGSNTPHFEIVSGVLPTGMQLDSRTGVVSGRPTVVGRTSAVVRITVDGYSGHLDADLHLQVQPFYAMYLTDTVAGQIGLPIEGVTPQVPDSYDAGVTVRFALANGTRLPPGLSLNATTGAISGVPTEVGSFSAEIDASATHGDTRVTASTTLSFFIEPITDVFFLYDGFDVPGGAAVNVAPIVSKTGSDTFSGYRLANGADSQHGLRVDAATGVVTGTAPATAGRYEMEIEATLTRGSLTELRQATFTMIVY